MSLQRSGDARPPQKIQPEERSAMEESGQRLQRLEGQITDVLTRLAEIQSDVRHMLVAQETAAKLHERHDAEREKDRARISALEQRDAERDAQIRLLQWLVSAMGGIGGIAIAMRVIAGSK